MKKVLALALGMMLLPMTAFGMQMLSESDMDSVTGQSGVAIALDDVKVWQHEGDSELWYLTNFENDAFYRATAGGAGVQYGSENDAAIGLVWGNNSYSMTHVNALGAISLSATNLYSPGRDLQGTYPAGVANSAAVNEVDTGDVTYKFGNFAGDTLFKPSALTITVSDDLQLIAELVGQAEGVTVPLNETSGLEVTGVNPVAGVRIGLPTVELYVEPGSQDELQILVTQGEVGLNPIGARADDGATHSFGTLFMTQSGSTTALLDGFVEIAPLSGYAAAVGDDDLTLGTP